MFSRRYYAFTCIIVLLLIPFHLRAQLNLGAGLSLSGNTSIHYQYYNTKLDPGAFVFPRQPTHYPQYRANLALKYKNAFKIPIQIALSPVIQVNQFGINTPVEGPKSLSIFEFLSHPANHIYINPSYKSANIHLGHFIQRYSELSTGDIKVFGIAADYKMNNFKFSAQRGLIQPKVANVAFNFNNGTYKRSLTAFRIGIENSDQLSTALQFSYVGDKQASLEEVPMVNKPEKSGVVSLSSTYKLDKKTSLGFEIANSSWAPNTLAVDTLREFGLSNFLMSGTNVFNGFAFALNGRTEFENIKATSHISWKSKNYRTLAYPFMQSDMLDIEFNTSLFALEKKLQTNATLAYKGSNLSKTYGNSLRIPILKLASKYSFTEQIKLSAVYAYNSVSSPENDFGQQVKSSNNVFNLIPSYHFNHQGFNNSVSLILGANKYSNKSSFLPAENKASSINFGLSYRISNKLHSAGIAINRFASSRMETVVFKSNSVTINARTKLLEQKLAPYARFTIASYANAATKLGSKFVVQCGGMYKVGNKMNASLGVFINRTKQGTGGTAPVFRELLIKTGLSYRI